MKNQQMCITKYSKKYDLLPADRIIVPVFQTGLSKHHAIFLGENAFGQELIAENHFQDGVRIVRADKFFKSAENCKVDKFSGNRFARHQALQRALSLVGKPYNLFFYNCEHYANEVQTGKSRSRQVGLVLLVLLFVCVMTMLDKSE